MPRTVTTFGNAPLDREFDALWSILDRLVLGSGSTASGGSGGVGVTGGSGSSTGGGSTGGSEPGSGGTGGGVITPPDGLVPKSPAIGEMTMLQLAARLTRLASAQGEVADQVMIPSGTSMVVLGDWQPESDVVIDGDLYIVDQPGGILIGAGGGMIPAAQGGIISGGFGPD